MKESVSAINHSLGQKNEFSLSGNKELLSKLKKIKKEDIAVEFEKICKVLVDGNEKFTLKCIYNFCYDILMADGIVDEAEEELLNIAKKYFIK